MAETPRGRRALTWGTLMAVVGFVMVMIGNGMRTTTPATQVEAIIPGLVAGIGGWLVIIAVVVLVVGIVRRVRSH